MNKYPIIATIICSFLVLAGCTTPTPPPPGELEILNHRMIKGESGFPEVNITVQNVGSSTIGFAQIEVSFYDSSGDIIETAEDGITELKPSESWNFRIPCKGFDCKKIKTYTIKTTAMTSSRH